MDIKGLSAIVTGGGSGLGAETARALIAAGAKVVTLDIKNADVECDVTSETSVIAALETVKKKIGVPRILINCAGIAPGARVVGKDGAHDLALFNKVIAVNLIGTFNMLRLCAAEMTKLDAIGEERGVIINTASVAAYEGQIGQAAYSASKGGVVGMTLPAARDLAKFGIRVVTIAPGLMETPMLAGMPKEVQDSLIATTVFPKRLGKATEFAKLALHIVDNTLINGETIRLDGAVRLAPK